MNASSQPTDDRRRCARCARPHAEFAKFWIRPERPIKVLCVACSRLAHFDEQGNVVEAPPTLTLWTDLPRLR